MRPPGQPTGTDARADTGLGDLCVGLGREEIVSRLGAVSGRGGLPGVSDRAPQGALFSAGALGSPFDKDLLAHASEEGGRTRLRFSLAWRLRTPAAYLAAMVLTVEPGRYFVELMIPGSWGWGGIWWWYYPLTILPIPPSWWLFVRQTRASTLESARKAREAIKRCLAAEECGP